MFSSARVWETHYLTAMAIDERCQRYRIRESRKRLEGRRTLRSLSEI